MKKAKIFASGAMKIGEVSPALFGSFVEHLGRCVYTGIFEPGHETADAEGFREDVLELVRGLGISNVRYPGGNFLSGYNWRDGIGRKENRPVRLDLAWETIETNQFGTDEFVSWCRKAGAEPMIGVNMGTGSPKDAAELVEYCNHPGGTYLSDMRAENGYREPHGIKTWCLGNEMDGPWQICSLTAEDYGKKALAAARMMRMVDPSIKLVACGSSSAEMETFPDWDRHILETLYDEADYISIHQYYWPRWEEADYLASYLEMDNYIKDVKATIDYVKAKRRSRKRMAISFDEWNIWYQRRQWESGWKAAPRKLEDIYSYTDALVFSGLLNTLINNCDIVKFACLAQLVNVIAPIFTEPGGSAVKQTIYYPFELASRYGRG
ncbi:MAG: alpha-N-arabinofuranosidase, partial [Clostridiales bacterium]|nr:alpha-N-arabinofuranosidase [Clostridiales bacterium]